MRDEPDYLKHRQRLRERFEKGGLEGFADYEVVELLLTLAIPRRDVKPQAKELMRRFGSLRGILDAPLGELRQVRGLGTVAPVALRIVRAAADLYLQQQAEQAEPLAEPEALRRFWRSRIGALPNEVFEVAFLDCGYRLLRDGGLNDLMVEEARKKGVKLLLLHIPREVMESSRRWTRATSSSSSWPTWSSRCSTRRRRGAPWPSHWRTL